MNNNSYTLIAYKSDSEDYCRGCHMASYPADFKLYHSLTKEELVERWAALKGYELSINESGYEFTIFQQGLLIRDGNLDCNMGKAYPEYDSEGYWDLNNKIDQLQDELSVIEREVDIKVIEIKKKREDAKLSALQIKERAEAEQTRQQELRQLERLKSKYGQ